MAAGLTLVVMSFAACAGPGREAFRAGELARSRGHLDEARDAYERALEQEPTNAEYRAALGGVLDQEIEAHRREAAACEEAGDLDGAARARNRALQVSPERSDLLLEYRLAEARASGATAFQLYALAAELSTTAPSRAAQEAAEVLRPLAYLETTRAADEAEVAGRFGEALDHLRNAQRVEPELPGIQHDRMARLQAQAWMAAGNEALPSDPVLAFDLFRRAKATFDLDGLGKRLKNAERRARPILEKLEAARARAASGRGRDALRLYGQVLKMNGGERTPALPERDALRQKLMLQECRRAELAADRGSFLLAHRALKDALEFSVLTGRQRRLVLQGIDESRRRKHTRAWETLNASTLPSDDPVLMAARSFVVATARRATEAVEAIILEKPLLARKRLKALRGLEPIIPELAQLATRLETNSSTTTAAAPGATTANGSPDPESTLDSQRGLDAARATDRTPGAASQRAPNNPSPSQSPLQPPLSVSVPTKDDDREDDASEARRQMAELAHEVAVAQDPRPGARQLWLALRSDPSSRVLARARTVLRARARRTALRRVSPEAAWALEAAGMLDGLDPPTEAALQLACARLAEGDVELAQRLFAALGGVSETAQLGAELARNLRIQELRRQFETAKAEAKVLREAALLAAIRSLAPSDRLVRTESRRVEQDAIAYGLERARALLETGQVGLAWVTLRRVAAIGASALRSVEGSAEMSAAEARLRASRDLTLVVEDFVPAPALASAPTACRGLEALVMDDFTSKASARTDLGAFVLGKLWKHRFLQKDPAAPVVFGALAIGLDACHLESLTGTTRASLRLDVPRGGAALFRVEVESVLDPGALPRDEADEQGNAIRALLAAETAERLVETMLSQRDATRSWLRALSDHALQHADVSLAAEAYARLEFDGALDEEGTRRRAALSTFLDAHLE